MPCLFWLWKTIFIVGKIRVETANGSVTGRFSQASSNAVLERSTLFSFIQSYEFGLQKDTSLYSTF
jgi:hypothetical protein